jgi:hypothetical protein
MFHSWSRSRKKGSPCSCCWQLIAFNERTDYDIIHPFTGIIWLLENGSFICCIPPWKEKQHGHEQESFQTWWCDPFFHVKWQTSEYNSQLYTKVFIVNVDWYVWSRLNTECACPHAEFMLNQRKWLISVHLWESWEILWDFVGLCMSHKCTCHNVCLCRMEARPKHGHVQDGLILIP